MIKKPIKNLIQTAFILILGFVLTICTVSAETSTNDGTTTNSPTKETKVETSLKKSNQLVNITLSTEDTTATGTTRKYKPLVGKKLTYWRISDALTGTADEIENKKVDIVNGLRSMKYDEMVKRYGVPGKTGSSNLDGLISIDMKNDSLYYFMESATNATTGPVVASFLLNMPKDEVGTISVQSKNTGDNPPDKPNTGVKKFVKMNESAKVRLADAWFKVSIKKSDGKYYAVKRDGVDYMVNSDKNGNFEVTGLDLGVKYYLVEVKSPTGYSQLAAPVEFTVDLPDSINQTVKVINNKPNPYDKTPNNTNNQGGKGGSGNTGSIVVPKTGDIMLFLLVLAGGLVSSLGVLMVRDSKKHLAESN